MLASPESLFSKISLELFSSTFVSRSHISTGSSSDLRLVENITNKTKKNLNFLQSLLK